MNGKCAAARWCRLMGLVASVLTSSALAQICPPYPLAPDVCDPALHGDPVHMARGTAYYKQRDVSLELPSGSFSIDRYFVSNASAWTQWGNSTNTPGLKGPFGKGLQGTGLRWWNSLHSLVYQPGGTYVYVRDRSGAVTEFANGCTGGGVACWLPKSGQAKAARGHLRRDSAGLYHLTTEAGDTLSYEASRVIAGNTHQEYYLSSGTTPQGQPLFSVQYFDESDAGVVPGCSSADRGVPFVESVTFGSASPEELRFFYELKSLPDAGSPQCLLERIEHWESSVGPSTTLAQYEYGLFDNGAGLGFELTAVRGAPDAGVREAYSYGTPAAPVFARELGGTTVVNQALSDAGTFIVAGSHGGGPDRLSVTSVSSFGAGGGFCPASTCCIEPSSSGTLSEVVEAFQDGGVAMKTSYFNVMNLGHLSHRLEVFKRTESWVSGPTENVSAGTVEWHRLPPLGVSVCGSGSGAPSPLWGIKNKLGYFTVTPWRWTTPSTGPVTVSVLEPAGERRGALSSDGGGALESVDYTFVYGPREDRHLSESTRASVIQPGGSAQTIYDYDLSTSRLKARFDVGWTREFDAGVAEQRYVATFYKLSRACDSDTTPDPHFRPLRIEGPCFVTSTAATSCSGQFPVREFHYFGPSTTGANRAGRLQFVKRFPANVGSSCGSPLTTEYVGYSATGLPTEMVDESGATVEFEYAGGKLVKRSQVVSGSTRQTTYSYEGDQLVKVTQPRGNSELFCYRTGGGVTSTCTGGTLTRLLQWRAKFDTSMNWTEKVSYTYWADETLASEEYWENASGTPSVRLRKGYERDAHKRLVAESTGSGGASVTTRRAYDANDNLTRIGTSFAGATAFCATNPESCAWLSYDRADRQVQLDVFPDAPATTNQKRTCINYNSNGDVRRVVSGCDGTTACNADGGVDSCNAGWIDYETDDFGNLVTITYPWTHSSTTRGTMRFAFDALGNVIKKKSAEMVNQAYHLLYTYDSIGRLKKLERKNNSGSSVQLFALTYDGAEGVESGCPAASFAGGRLTAREDSFGLTRLLYDEAGAVTKEVRRRYGLTGCTGDTSVDKNPHTSYQYNDNGDLTQIIYPHGRTVNYSYPSSGAMDRPMAVSYTPWVSGAWAAAATAVDLIWWEPYGELRSYRLTTSGGGAGQWVEYFRGSNAETTVGAGTCSALSVTGPSDQTGRLRGVFVSSGSYKPGSPNGNIFKQVYTWDDDQLVEQATCHRNLGNRVVETFGYDKSGRLVSHNDQVAGANTFAYDRRDIRTSATVASPSTCNVAANFWAAAWQVDMPFSNRWGATYGTTCSANGKYNYWYDLDGRRTDTWDEYNKFHVTTNFVSAPDGGVSGSGLESVYHSATLAGGNYQSDSYGTGTYSYFYDALGRRRAKTTPWSSTDEYFYDLGHQLLSDRGGDNIGSSSLGFPEDDYVWLGGRPVMLVRGRFQASTWNRLEETTSAWCTRNGENFVCGERPIVTDYLGKPVLMLDRGGTAYTATYEAFGYANRHEYRVGSPHYVAGSTNVATIAEPIPSGFDGTLRFLLSRSNYGALSSITVNGATEAATVGDRSHVWTTWRTSGSNTWTIAWNGSTPAYGFDLEAYEMRIKQVGTVWASTPLRYPGQYFDAETELHENWNRNYDPSTGRYLSSEPLLQEPNWVKDQARAGMSVPTYSYAFNNPLRYVDPTGLAGTCGPGGIRCATTASGEIAEAGWVAGQRALTTAAVVGGGVAVLSSPSSPKPLVIPIPLGCSDGNGDCDKLRKDMMDVCRDSYHERGVGSLVRMTLCRVCTESSYLQCKGLNPSPVSNLVCEKLMGKYGGFPL